MKFTFGNCRLSCSTVDVEKANLSSVHPINKSRNVCSFLYCNILNLLLIWIFCVSCLIGQSLGETSRPLNRAALNGDRIQLNCSTQETVNGYWKYTKPFERIERRIYNGVKVVNGMTTIFSVDYSVQGSFNLIFNAFESTSGRYTCQPDLNTADESAEVIVLDTAPNCSKAETSDIVNASCTIDFNGNWAPKIQWHNMNGRIEKDHTTTVQNSRVTSFLIVPANQTDNLTCTPTFVLENKPRETTATNLPELLTNCTLRIGSSSDVSSTQSTTTVTATTPSPPPYYVIISIVVCVCTFVILSIFGVILYKRNAISSARPARYSDYSAGGASEFHADQLRVEDL